MTQLTHIAVTGSARQPSRSALGGLYQRFEQPIAITPQDLIEALKRRKGAILLSMIVAGLLAFNLAKVLPSAFTATGLLLIDTQQFNIPELQALTSQRTVEPWGGRSEARVLTSHQVVEKVVATLALDQDPLFNPTLRDTWAEALVNSINLPQALRQGVLTVFPAPEPDFGPAIRAEIVRELSESLIAYSEERSYAIELTYTSPDPETAARIVNALMDVYIAEQVNLRRTATEEAGQRLKESVDALRAELDAARARVEEEEAGSSDVRTAEGTISSRQLSEAISQRRQIVTERNALAADLGVLRSAMASGNLTALDADLVTPRLQGLWAEEATVRRQMAQDSIELGPRHPRLVALETQVDSIQEQIRQEAAGIASSLEQRIRSLQNQEQSLAQQIAAGQTAAVSAAREQTRLAQLQDDVRAKQELYTLYRTRYEQTRSNSDLQGSDIRIASRAAPPTEPSSPGTGLLTAAGILIGFLVASAVIVARRWLSPGVESLEEAMRLTGLPGLGAVPSVSTWLKPRQSLAEFVVRYPTSSVTETIRGILLRLHRASVEDPLKTLLVTSAEPGEGKTSFCLALGRTAAKDGLRCLVVDCDFRRPALAKQTNLAPTASLNDYLNGSLDWGQDAIIKDAASGLDMLLATQTQQNQRDFVSSSRLRVLMAEARQYYDLVIIDSPPVMNVPDAIQLADLADAIVCVTRWRRTRRKVIGEALRRIAVAGRPLAGLVLSQVRGAAQDEYVYSGYS